MAKKRKSTKRKTPAKSGVSRIKRKSNVKATTRTGGRKRVRSNTPHKRGSTTKLARKGKRVARARAKPKAKKTAARKPASRKPRQAVRPPSRKRLEQEIKRLRSELREVTRQQPSKPPSHRRKRPVVTQEEIDEGIPFAPDRQTIPREYAPVEAGEFEDIAADFDDLSDYGWDDFYDEVGDEDEDSYGEDGG